LKILIAPDKFKGSLTAQEVCESIEAGILTVKPDAEVVKLPLADGGEGFSEAIIGVKIATKNELTVNDPLFRLTNAYFYKTDNNVTIIEMSNASGLTKLSNFERNPLKTSSFGTGELIKRAIESGSNEIIVGIGGSATNDAGMGMATAMGYKFYDKNNQELRPIGESLAKAVRMTEPANKPWSNISIKVACDVQNTLYGINGAAYVFAPQKGANAQQVKELDEGLRNFSRVVNKHFGKNFHFTPGAGAAGGMGYGLIAFLNATLHSGIDLIFDANSFIEKLKNVDMVITGEGKIDNQTLEGKVIAGVCKKALALDIPVFAICGVNELAENQVLTLGVQKIYSLKNEQTTSEFAMKNAKELLKKESITLMQSIQ
jgi:glycerate 2-kinase